MPRFRPVRTPSTRRVLPVAPPATPDPSVTPSHEHGSSDDAHWREIENIQVRIHDLSAALGMVLGDHAHRAVELDLDLTDALAGVACEITELSHVIEAVVRKRHTENGASSA
jgi:hypothetical protein